MGKRDECNSVFAELFRFHMRNGTRPDGRPGEMGRIWNNKRLAGEIGASPRTIRNWLNGKTLPAELESIERVFFGDTRIYDSERRQLRELYDAAMSVRSVRRVRHNRISYTGLIKQPKAFRNLGNGDLSESSILEAYGYCLAAYVAKCGGSTLCYDLYLGKTFPIPLWSWLKSFCPV